MVTHAIYLFLHLEHLLCQLESHLIPSLDGRPFVVVEDVDSPTARPMDVSAEAITLGVREHMPVADIATRYPTVVIVQATPLGLSTQDLPVLQAYRERAEKGPVTFLRKIVDGEGLLLQEEEEAGSKAAP